jgi:teichuronic acid biosynthesis glycosyltransferase TuaG
VRGHANKWFPLRAKVGVVAGFARVCYNTLFTIRKWVFRPMPESLPLEGVPEVSVVITSYNAGAVLSEAIDSVLRQRGVSVEVIVVDDCSREDPFSLLPASLQQDARLRCVRLDKNSGGPARPRNVGVSEARGEFVAFLDCDDIWCQGKLAHDLFYLREAGADVVSSRKVRFIGTPPLTETVYGQEVRARPVSFLTLLLKNRLNLSATTLRTSLARQMPFHEPRDFAAVEDYHVWLRLARRGARILLSDAKTLNYRLAPGSISSGKHRMVKKVMRVQRDVFPVPTLFPLFVPLLFVSYVTLSFLDRLRGPRLVPR